MGRYILLAEPYDVLRSGLQSIFATNYQTSDVLLAANYEELLVQLQCRQFDLIVVNQLLVTEFAVFARTKYVVMATQLDLTALKSAFLANALGYISINSSVELLLTLLHPRPGAFLIEPAFIPLIMDGIFDVVYSSIRDDLLTPREKEIVDLLCQGISRGAICRKLCIAETTLKTHIKNITHKGDYFDKSIRIARRGIG